MQSFVHMGGMAADESGVQDGQLASHNDTGVVHHLTYLRGSVEREAYDSVEWGGLDSPDVKEGHQDMLLDRSATATQAQPGPSTTSVPKVSKKQTNRVPH